jgi:hypothetical protein
VLRADHANCLFDSLPEIIPAAMNDLLTANLKALAATDPAAAALIEQATALPGVEAAPAKRESAIAISIATPLSARPVALCSAHAPLTEAARFAEKIDLQQNAAFVVLGFGAGYHVKATLERVGEAGVVVAYEPDTELLRAVLERIDCTDWIGSPRLALFAGDVDQAAITRRLEVAVGQIAQGVQLLTHPPTRQRNAEALNAFGQLFAQFVAFCRTNVATTLVNSPITCENLTRNLDHYAAGGTINDLKGAAAGKPAVLVAAGPSLARNVNLLAEPGVRDRVVIITAQTTLKLLLDYGVRPHFVTALDYHEISKRFYEDLPRLDDVTLIAEPKANRAILESYPGPVRVCRSSFLDTLLGSAARAVDPLPAGSTVAHLSFYFAQYLGCDPIIFTGQDLGFSDGVYYCPGTAIHQVWSGELSPFNTLEMMEWQRVARHRNHLQKMTDVHGRPIYSDEQMITYLRQFERDFAAAPQHIIDATEGGMPKAHTEQVALADALKQHASVELDSLPLAAGGLDRSRLEVTRELLARRVDEVRELAQISRQTVSILKQMIERQTDQQRVNKLFDRLEKQQRKAAERSEAFQLVEQLNQIGVFKRQQADRQIAIGKDDDPLTVQRKQLERDLLNLKWLIDGCDQTLGMFRQTLGRIDEQLKAKDAARGAAP